MFNPLFARLFFFLPISPSVLQPFSLQMATVVFSLMLHKCISAAGCVYDETVAFTSSCLLSGSLSGSVCFCSVLGRRCISLILLSSRLALFCSAADPTSLLKATDTLMRSEQLCLLWNCVSGHNERKMLRIGHVPLSSLHRHWIPLCNPRLMGISAVLIGSEHFKLLWNLRCSICFCFWNHLKLYLCII